MVGCGVLAHSYLGPSPIYTPDFPLPPLILTIDSHHGSCTMCPLLYMCPILCVRTIPDTYPTLASNPIILSPEPPIVALW